MQNLSKGVINYLDAHLPIKCEMTRSENLFQSVIKDMRDERFRRKRDLSSEDNSGENCEKKLAKSFECYRTELSKLSAALESSHTSELSPQGRHKHQHQAGCDLIGNILNQCDQQLCNPSSHDSNANTYDEYVRTILPDFEVQRCGTF
jgi:hypothetical protein